MPIDVACPDCFQEYSVKDSLAGKKIRCKECEGIIKVERKSSPDEDLDELEDADEIPAPRKSRASAGKADKGAKSGKAAGRKKSAAGTGPWSGVPWKSGVIPLGVMVVCFGLARILPYPMVLFFKVMAILLTLVGGLAGLYMLARVTSRAQGDITMEQVHGVKRLGRVAGNGATSALVVFGLFAFVFVALKGMIREPGKTIPWFLMMTLGISGFVFAMKYDRDAFKPGAHPVSNPQQDAEWKKWEEEMRIKH
jgi:hypothetical protein